MEMLDEEHQPLPQPSGDTNIYNLGSINNHNVVIAGLPKTGNCSAATVVTQMRMTFPRLKYGLLVGIGGGVPVKTDTGIVRLGHVVVSEPIGIHSGAVQYDHGKLRTGHFERKGSLLPPPTALLNAAREVAVKRQRVDHDPIWENVQRIQTDRGSLNRFKFPGLESDYLYKPSYQHRETGISCEEGGCDPHQRIPRPMDDRGEKFVMVHRGTVASGELVIKDAQLRDNLAKEHGVLCFEMEAAGALADFPCMVIRGISDYCDSHKNDAWHGYAAAVAAAYARQLFFHMSVGETIRPNLSSNSNTKVDPHVIEEFHKAVKNHKITLVKLWLERVDVNIRDPRTGRTALSFAAENNDIDIAKILLDHEALVNVRQYSRPGDNWGGGPGWTSGRTELSWAADCGHCEMAELLLKHGAHPNSPNSVGRTPLHYACMGNNRRLAKILVENGADGWAPIDEILSHGHVDLLKMFLDYEPLLNSNTGHHGHGRAPLHCAVIKKSSILMSLLLDKRANPDIGMTENITPLHIAAAADWIEGIKILVASGASVDAKDSLLLETPLHKAARNCSFQAYHILVRYGANPQEQNIDGQDCDSILDCAQENPNDWHVSLDKVYFLT
ncbi:Ankyrin repeat protein [Penicillium fimorum]|uniref:Ankyrin repeat protein n=1 Tax=Penicillium fimorum TaxID=1882269 RepID=A0A9X0C908_9EURO|nr:Ankyrin repeat protein [Penicillium fimorum]